MEKTDPEKTDKPAKRPPAPAAIKASGSDEAFVKHLALLDEKGGEEAIIWLRLSRLDAALRAGKRVQAVTKALAEVTKRFRGRLFLLHSGDMVVCCGGGGRAAIDETIALLHNFLDGIPRVPRDARQSGLWAVFDSNADRATLATALQAIQADLRARLEAADRARQPRQRKRAINTQPLSTRARILVLAGLLLACAAMLFLADRSQRSVWVFDTPDAQKPHLLHDTWTGDYSR